MYPIFNKQWLMKTTSVLYLILMVTFNIVSCNSSKKAAKNIKISLADNSLTSLDWDGIYQGILPCAGCEGIQTQIVLNNDLTYVHEIRYNGKDEKVFLTKGTFHWNENGSKITFDNTEKQIYQVGENKLFHLDKDGKRITGNLADNYIIEKEKIELTGKYWKLVRLNGKPFESREREAFVSFTKEENRVHGNSSCNMFNGNYELLEGNRINFSPFAMTKMACIGNKIELEFIAIFEKTTSYSITSNVLIFQDEYETTLAKFESDFFK